MATPTLIDSHQKNVYQNDLSKDFRAKTPSTQREEFLPNRETIGQNQRASGQMCFCLSSSPDKQNKVILCALCASAVNNSYCFLRTWRPLRLCARHYPGEYTVKSPIIVRDGASFVCLPLPTNKNRNSLRSLRLCGKSLSAKIGENRRLIILTLRTMRSSLCLLISDFRHLISAFAVRLCGEISESSSILICGNLRESAVNSSSPNLAPFASWREISFFGCPKFTFRGMSHDDNT